ncbi:MAG: ABC transporter ATP-binding protein [Ignavibacteria bacterium RIFOXYB2_FULL_35_12]|nr:MAG: ABC transporter ATP-binding protein [Ignavibacteria bacterium GWA2_36_19]OGU60811.1 MAG: ABC transporter ATP-binding protein [Ignavibacteria bacterium GWF2_35_20]OGU83107.1 MAG: ABC transporter ATP-binding protein [Ignavibacteria bacterium RIFOXYA2_FULL_35_9]OGU84185.1 MAG: ABC transporter ATP-binding protein [Ignavibacteria bacterium RIFOXYA12_FULL_35_25]OGU90056.1 MAG: ABC transporter ATP-binding protein [Ignavibacteria bacterium RIFOXYC12_FULL_35_11]OGU97335.1 MAG: ABC transporter A
MLEIKNLNTGYDKKQVVFNVSMNVLQGEIVSLIGPNSAGKSTILKAICGLIPSWSGEIAFNSKKMNGNEPPENLKLGISFCPQGNRVFDELTVRENLEIGGYILKKDKTSQRIHEVLEIFPALKDRIKQTAGSLSGGEQQMLAVARALIPEPKLLLLDEPSLGLAPNLVKELFDKFIELNKKLGITILIVEQKVREVLAISNRVYSLKLGKVAYEGRSGDLLSNKEELKTLFL